MTGVRPGRPTTRAARSKSSNGMQVGCRFGSGLRARRGVPVRRGVALRAAFPFALHQRAAPLTTARASRGCDTDSGPPTGSSPDGHLARRGGAASAADRCADRAATLRPRSAAPQSERPDSVARGASRTYSARGRRSVRTPGSLGGEGHVVRAVRGAEQVHLPASSVAGCRPSALTAFTSVEQGLPLVLGRGSGHSALSAVAGAARERGDEYDTRQGGSP